LYYWYTVSTVTAVASRAVATIDSVSTLLLQQQQQQQLPKQRVDIPIQVLLVQMSLILQSQAPEAAMIAVITAIDFATSGQLLYKLSMLCTVLPFTHKKACYLLIIDPSLLWYTTLHCTACMHS
jgi:hypothetical protein